MAIYPSKMAPIGVKLWENVFQTIPDISFFDPPNETKKTNANFDRPFTPRGWLRLAPNFGKTRFRRSPTFHFSMPKTQNKMFFVANFDPPLTLREWLRWGSNFAKMRFRRSPTFHFSTTKSSKFCQKNANFGRPFTSRGWLRLARNFAKTRFR